MCNYNDPTPNHTGLFDTINAIVDETIISYLIETSGMDYAVDYIAGELLTKATQAELNGVTIGDIRQVVAAYY